MSISFDIGLQIDGVLDNFVLEEYFTGEQVLAHRHYHTLELVFDVDATRGVQYGQHIIEIVAALQLNPLEGFVHKPELHIGESAAAIKRNTHIIFRLGKV